MSQQNWGDVKRGQILRALGRVSYPLTVRVIGRRVRLRSPSSVQNHIEQLEAAGFIQHIAGWTLTDKGRAAVEEMS